MDEITREPLQIRAEDINPRFNWGRALPALGIMGVDLEERVDYRRLHRYRRTLGGGGGLDDRWVRWLVRRQCGR